MADEKNKTPKIDPVKERQIPERDPAPKSPPEQAPTDSETQRKLRIISESREFPK